MKAPAGAFVVSAVVDALRGARAALAVSLFAHRTVAIASALTVFQDAKGREGRKGDQEP
jgi:hypothetical protein